MYLWQIEYNLYFFYYGRCLVVNRFKLCIFDRLNTTTPAAAAQTIRLWIALNYVSLTDWIQLRLYYVCVSVVVNRFKLCIFDRLNTTIQMTLSIKFLLWIALNYVSLTDWIQQFKFTYSLITVVNRFKLCIFDRLNTTYQLMKQHRGCCESL